MRWIAAFPCWGADYARRAIAGPLRSVVESMLAAGVGSDGLILINTDDWRHFEQFAKTCPFEVQFWRVPREIKRGSNEQYSIFGNCHRQAIDMAYPGDAVAFMCGDMTVSIDAFASAKKIFANGRKKLIVAAASGVTADPPPLPSRTLLAWSLENLAPMCRDLFWGEGKGLFPWCVYFRHERGVDFRGFHLHPAFCVKRDGLTFHGSTVDYDLSSQFEEDEIHVVRDPDEMAMVARAIPGTRDSGFIRIGVLALVTWAVSMGSFALPRHFWQFGQQITLAGEPDPDNYKIAERTMRWVNRARRGAERRAALKFYRAARRAA